MNRFAILLFVFAAFPAIAVDYCRIDITPADNLFVIIYDEEKEDFVQCNDKHIVLYETVDGVYVNNNLVIPRPRSLHSPGSLDMFAQVEKIIAFMKSGEDLESAVARYIENRSIIMNALTEFVVDNINSLGVTTTVQHLNSIIDEMDPERAYIVGIRPDTLYENSVIVEYTTQKLSEARLGRKVPGITIDEHSIPRSRDIARPMGLERPFLDCRQIEPFILEAAKDPSDNKVRCIIVGRLWAITPRVFPNEEAMWRSIRRGW